MLIRVTCERSVNLRFDEKDREWAERSPFARPLASDNGADHSRGRVSRTSVVSALVDKAPHHIAARFEHCYERRPLARLVDRDGGHQVKALQQLLSRRGQHIGHSYVSAIACPKD